MKSFEKLENCYRLTGTLELKQATHVGCGEAGENVDAVFISNNDGQRYIPGSSLRGALRSTVERLLASLDPSKSCLLDGGTITNCPTSNDNKKDAFKKLVETGKPEKDLFNFLATNLCCTCRVFGSPFLASRVKVMDLRPQNNNNPQSQIRHYVGIDRDTETAAKGVLFSFEVVDRGEKFDFELWAENVEDQDLGVLGLGILELLSGNFRVGAKGAVGLGQCQLVESSLKLEFYGDINGLLTYLSSQDFPEKKTGAQVKAFFLEKVKKLLGEPAHAKASD